MEQLARARARESAPVDAEPVVTAAETDEG
jgi:hypothetical protein